MDSLGIGIWARKKRQITLLKCGDGDDDIPNATCIMQDVAPLSNPNKQCILLYKDDLKPCACSN